MAHFYGTLQGQAKTTATRRGSKNSGITTVAASWNGAIKVKLFVDDLGRDCYMIEMLPWHGHGKRRIIETGVLEN